MRELRTQHDGRPFRTLYEIHIGRITGDYFHVASNDGGYPNRRKVEWVAQVPRTTFSQGALYAAGSAMSLFSIKNFADEFLAAASKKGPAAIAPVEDDETVDEVTEDVEETTRDYVLKIISQKLKGHPFAHFVAALLNTMGFKTRVSPEGADGGVDVIAHRDELGIEPPIIKVQCKSSSGSIGNQDVSAFKGVVHDRELGIFVSLGGFTKPARDYARAHSQLRLIDEEKLVDLVLSRYEQLDSGYKGVIPLKRVYVPAPKADADG